ncbi:excinuclease, ATPase subunit precursor [Ralstonia solanacearum]|nr:excinuclease, ATPase subunit precursor [Ralstonia solanacearum]
MGGHAVIDIKSNDKTRVIRERLLVHRLTGKFVVAVALQGEVVKPNK